MEISTTQDTMSSTDVNENVRESNIDREFAVIILGNAGAGKSFICNLLIGEEIFESSYVAAAVTQETTCHTLPCELFDLLIYDIPGLIESEQDSVDKNKKEIQKAFAAHQKAIIVFVLRETGGRVQLDDILAFEALNKAYKFPENSLMFMLNNVRPDRPPEFDAKFMVTLSNGLRSEKITTETMFFQETLGAADREKMNDARLKLFSFLTKRTPALQKKYKEIILRIDQIRELRAALRKQIEDGERDKAALQHQIKEMADMIQKLRQQSDDELIKLKNKIQQLETTAGQEKKGSNTLKFALGGASAGAAIGLIVGPVGAAVFGGLGALAGGAVGGVVDLFSTSGKN